MILSEKSATFRDHALDGSCSTRKTQSIDPTERFRKREGYLLATTGVAPDSARSGVPELQRASENHEQALESRNATFVEQHYFKLHGHKSAPYVTVSILDQRLIGKSSVTFGLIEPMNADATSLLRHRDPKKDKKEDRIWQNVTPAKHTIPVTITT